MSKATQADLARRIRTAQPVDKAGRYDTASKVEVKAFVKEEVERIEYEIGRIPALEARIAELELSVWAKIKRWFSSISKRIDQRLDSHTVTTITIEPPKTPSAEEILKAIKRSERTVGKSPELAAPYGGKEGVEIKQGEGLKVNLPLAKVDG
jgi:hypothetical protein